MDNAADESEIVVLGSDLRIGQVAELFSRLEGAAASGRPVALDASEVSKVDAAGLQLLAAAAVRFRTAGVTWRWHNRSAALVGAAQVLGLDGALELK